MISKRNEINILFTCIVLQKIKKTSRLLNTGSYKRKTVDFFLFIEKYLNGNAKRQCCLCYGFPTSTDLEGLYKTFTENWVSKQSYFVLI